jgi:hypothetical protein
VESQKEYHSCQSTWGISKVVPGVVPVIVKGANVIKLLLSEIYGFSYLARVFC